MKPKRKSRFFKTDEEYEAWKKQADENFHELRRMIERVKAELAAQRKPA